MLFRSMPVGNPKAQTIATKKYTEKVGLISKSYKLKKEVVEAFAKACEDNGESQAAVLTRMMKEYVKGKHDIE